MKGTMLVSLLVTGLLCGCGSDPTPSGALEWEGRLMPAGSDSGLSFTFTLDESGVVNGKDAAGEKFTGNGVSRDGLYHLSMKGEVSKRQFVLIGTKTQNAYTGNYTLNDGAGGTFQFSKKGK